MNNLTDAEFNLLFKQLERFSPELDESDIIAHAPTPSSSDPSLLPTPLPTQFLSVISQNVMKSNIVTHALSNIASSHSNRADIILVQEPWWDWIGLDVKSGEPILGLPTHPDWVAILPSAPDHRPDVAIYMTRRHMGWRTQLRSNLFSHPSILAVDVVTERDVFMIVNIYNPSDSSSLPPLFHQQDILSATKTVLAGDFNLHHPLWSIPGHEHKTSPSSEALAEWCALKGFHMHNTPGAGTFFRKDYESVLDLLWSAHLSTPHISCYRIRHDLHVGADHYPSSFKISYSPEPPEEPSFSFRDDNRDSWQESFSTRLDATWTFHDYLPDAATFSRATDSLMDTMVEASRDMCQQKTRTSRASKWFNADVKDVLKLMRKSRAKCKATPTRHNLLAHKLSYQKFKYEVQKAKRSFALGIAVSVKANTSLWKLNSWYRGICKSLTPSLKHPNGGWATDSQDKVALLTEAWFPPPAALDPSKFVVQWDSPFVETRPFHPITFEEVEQAPQAPQAPLPLEFQASATKPLSGPSLCNLTSSWPWCALL